ncbi:MAG: hypothetical protein HYV60_13560 [Planctomycetia bacterium]|nr:hypothetical protein [Planctomycetia bacterium]
MQARLVEQFLANDITWLDELYSMAKQLPPPEDAIFTDIQMTTRQPSGAQIVFQGYTREAEQLSQLRESLRVQDRSIESTGTSDDARRQDYNWRFKETLYLTKTISLDQSSAGSATGGAEAPSSANKTARAPVNAQVPVGKTAPN